MDYYALLAGGAPDNEFDLESKEIAAKINDYSSVQEIALIITAENALPFRQSIFKVL